MGKKQKKEKNQNLNLEEDFPSLGRVAMSVSDTSASDTSVSVSAADTTSTYHSKTNTTMTSGTGTAGKSKGAGLLTPSAWAKATPGSNSSSGSGSTCSRSSSSGSGAGVISQSSPWGAKASLAINHTQQSVVHVEDKAVTVSVGVGVAWSINATKTAKLPLQIEKRKHKTVTVLKNINGDASVLLSSLKLSLGTGGKLVDGMEASGEGGGGTAEIEIQGDHLKRIANYLCDEHARLMLVGGGRGVLRGVSKAELATHGSVPKVKKGSATGSTGKSIAKLDQKAAALKQTNSRKK